jgi:hypothetical protein
MSLLKTERMMRTIYLGCLATLISFSAFTQVIDYNKQYFNAKDLFRT